MPPRIAIPVPTSTDLDYNRRAWPQYAEAVTRSGGIPVEIPLTSRPPPPPASSPPARASSSPAAPPTSTRKSTASPPIDPETNPADPARENVDELLLQDAHNLRKPILAICFGTQMLNVWRGGTLVQHLTPMPVNHAAGAAVAVAHTAVLAPNSLLAELRRRRAPEAVHPEPPRRRRTSHSSRPTSNARTRTIEPRTTLRLPINSSHHQAIGIPGDGLRVTARSPEDGVIEAVESTPFEPRTRTSNLAS
jgi:putative glutamine amidotransferase